MLKEWQVRNGLLFFCRFMEKKVNIKKTRIGYKIRILGQKIQPGIRIMFVK